MLLADYGRLQEQNRDLEQLKDTLEVNEVTWRINLTDAQKDAEHTRHEVQSSLKESVPLCYQKV